MILLLFSIISFAEEYENLQLVPIPPEYSSAIQDVLAKNNFDHQSSMSELSSIGINQVYFSSGMQGFVTVKFDVKGKFPLNLIQDLEDGKLIHIEVNNKIIAFFFHNISEFQVAKLTADLKELKLQKTSFFKSLAILPSAHAVEDCGELPNVINQDAVKAMKKTSAGGITSLLFSCLNGGQNAVRGRFDYSSTYADVKNAAVEFWETPSKKIGDYYHAVSGAVSGFINFGYLLGEALIHPETGLPKIQQKLGAAGEMFVSVLSMVSLFPLELGVNITCSLVSGIGVDAFIGALTGGAASVKLLLTLKRLSATFDVLGKIKKLMDRLKMSKLEELGLSVESLKKLFQKMLNGTLDSKKFEVFSKSLESDSSLARTFATQGLQCSL